MRSEIAPLSRVPLARLRTSVLVKRGDSWYVRFDRVTREGTPVAGAYAEARVTRGRLVLLRVETHPDAEGVPVPARIGRASAIAAAEREIRPRRTVASSDAAFVIAPIAAGGGWTYRPAWDVTTRASTREAWRTRVDAVSGEVLSRTLLTPSLEGRFTGMVEPRTVGDALAELPLPHLLVSTTAAGSAVSSTDGRWSFADPGPLSVSAALAGPYFTVLHATAAEGSVTFEAADGASDHPWTAPDDATQAEIAAFRHASTVREWALRRAPELAWLQSNVEVSVGVAGQCNAIYDGTIVLYGEGATCNDTARIADVVYHEYGHGFHAFNRVSGVIDPSVGEGAGDYLSATITNSPRIGLALYKNTGGDGALRDVEVNKVYPQDVGAEVHENGLIFAGAMWDARTALRAALGTSAGTMAADALFTDILAAGPTLDQTFVEALLADDDDANLANGTPNVCLLEVAFGLHGLAGASGLFSLEHEEPAGEMAAGEPVPVTATRPAAASLCASTETTAATVHWLVDEPDGASGSVEMTLAGDTFHAEIPGAPANRVVRYWFESALETGDTILTPLRAPVNTFAYHAGPLEVVWEDDFESATGWTSGGEQDDWQIGAPQGLAGDPPAAHSGANVLGNRLDGDGLYAKGAASWIESPAIDCRKCRNARLRLRRWANVQQAISDRAAILVNGVPVWQNEQGITFDELSVQDPLWSYQEYDISELADGGANVRIRLTLESDVFLEFGGMTIDDIAIVMPAGGGGASVGGGGCGCALTPAPSRGAPLPILVLAALAAMLRRRAR